MNPVCGLNCQSSLKPVDFSDCNPEINPSEIARIFIAAATIAAFSDWNDPTEWAGRLDQSAPGTNVIRTFTVIGDKPAPTRNDKRISRNRRANLRKAHQLNATIDETSQTNHEFVRQTECGLRARIWYETTGGEMFGGNEGILADVNMDMVLNRGNEELMQYSFTATWDSQFTEERTTSPIFGMMVSSGGGNLVFANAFSFAASTTPAAIGGITATAPATNASLKFEFDNLPGAPTGTPRTMTLKLANATVLTVDYPSDYAGMAFRFRSTSGAVYLGQFPAATSSVNL